MNYASEDIIKISKKATPEEAYDIIKAIGYYNNYEPFSIKKLYLDAIGNVSDYHNDYHGNVLYNSYIDKDNKRVEFLCYIGEGYYEFNEDIKPDEARSVVENRQEWI